MRNIPKFSVRYGTVLYRLKTPSRRVGEVLSALAEGLSVGAAVRVFGHGEFTVRTWLTRAGLHAALLHERLFQGLKLLQVQLDELCTKTRQEADALWVWFAVDARTKVIAVLKVGPRTQPMAHAVVHALVKVLAPDCLPVFTSDGLKLYFYALTAHFGNLVETRGRQKPCWQVRADLLYGQLIKHCRWRRLVRVERRALLGSLDQLQAAMLTFGWSGKVQTAFVERLNLTVRQGIAALTRRTWGIAQSPAELLLHLQWWRAYYHFTRPHASLDEPLTEPRMRGGRRLPQRCRRRTPAQAAGITNHRWTIVELLSYPLRMTVGWNGERRQRENTPASGIPTQLRGFDNLRQAFQHPIGALPHGAQLSPIKIRSTDNDVDTGNCPFHIIQVAHITLDKFVLSLQRPEVHKPGAVLGGLQRRNKGSSKVAACACHENFHEIDLSLRVRRDVAATWEQVPRLWPQSSIL